MRRGFAAGAAGAVLIMVAGCSASASGTHVDQAAQAGPKVTVTPANGGKAARTDKGVHVKVTGGVLSRVTVKAGQRGVAGSLSAARTSWASRWTLKPNTRYTVTAVAVNATNPSLTTTKTTHFKTRKLKAGNTFKISSVLPNSTTGHTVGVGMPIIVNFNKSVTTAGRRKRVEKALVVTSTKSNQGAWFWNGTKQVIFRTKSYWQAHQNVTLVAHLAGIKVGSSYGNANTTLHFTVGHSRISKVSTVTHRMKVYQDGKLIKNTGISAGRGGEWKYYTTSGVHLTMQAVSPVIMTSPGISPGQPGYYKETVYYAVRISNSGEFVHSAPWSVAQQGHSNVSHGCINANPTFAKWFYQTAEWGDPVVITGTPRKLEWNNGFGYWQKSWSQWLAGSATKSVVKTH